MNIYKVKSMNAVLISKANRSAIKETLYLLSIPSMYESIKKGTKEPINKCEDKLKW